MNYCVLIPTINRKDLLTEALNCYKDLIPDVNIYILDNGNQNINVPAENIKCHVRTENLGVAGSWNYLINLAISEGYEYFLILNDDVILKKPSGVISQIIERYGENIMHIPKHFYHMSAFILSKKIFMQVGEFDENFKKCFFEDNDYKYRVKIAGFEITYRDELGSEVFRNSQTIELNPLLGGYIENKEYYIKKWGGIPTEEQYKTPFNA
jgi:GT2 family glycosyltransferase